MAKGMSIKDAIKVFEEKKGVVAAEVEKAGRAEWDVPSNREDGRNAIYAENVQVSVYMRTCDLLTDHHQVVSSLLVCRHLALSTNSIEKISSLSGMESLKILSLGRNLIKKIENLDAIADTLEELWISYNVIQSLSGIEKLQNLKVLLMSNNKIASWAEVDRLAGISSLEDLLLVGNPLYNDYKDNNALSDYRVEVIKRLPNIRKLDGIPVDVDEREQANAAKA
ncbi:uncharacterized protein HaLaN_07107 [Haematococcus lacustris]|uniref:Dynein axonemal light chain 1 n=1 Tax=Haematococcus lacustris TaxID=44745 RepID=A0A699YX52_HAELA|nr:uncharacterized protein HaLaN_07107 [Haematococcus lacustris]